MVNFGLELLDIALHLSGLLWRLDLHGMRKRLGYMHRLDGIE